MTYIEFITARKKLLYLLAVDKPVEDLPRLVARGGLEHMGRKLCPVTGQYYFDTEAYY